MRLMCDRMLNGLARWLRAAGYDTALAGASEAAPDLSSRCLTEDRVLVTRSRRLAQAMRPQVRTVLLIDDGLEAQALAVSGELALDWTRAPFTRCVVDNALLGEAADADLERLPERSRTLPGPFRVCPACGRVYWPGSHVRRMSARLQRWRDLGERTIDLAHGRRAASASRNPDWRGS